MLTATKQLWRVASINDVSANAKVGGGEEGQTATATRKIANKILVIMLKHTEQQPMKARATATACNRHRPKLSEHLVETC